MTCCLRPNSILFVLILFVSCASTPQPVSVKQPPQDVDVVKPLSKEPERLVSSLERYKLTLNRKRVLSEEWIDSCLVDRKMQTLFIASGNSIKMFRLAEGFPYLSELRFQLEDRRIDTIRVSSKHIFLGLSDETLIVADRQSGEVLFSVIGFYRRINSILPLDEATVLVADSRSVKTLDLSLRKVVSEYKSNAYDVYSLVLLDDEHFATGSGAGRIEVWKRTDTIAPVVSLARHDGEVIHLETDGELIFSFSRDNSVGVWSKDFKKVSFFIVHSAPVLSGSLTPDGSRTIVLYEDGFVGIFAHKERKILVCEKLEVEKAKYIFALDENNFVVLSGYGAAFFYIIEKQ